MRIGINCIYIDPEYTGGLNSFTIGLLNGFSNLSPENQFIIFVTPHNRDFFTRYSGKPNFTIKTIHLPSRISLAVHWRSIRLNSRWVYQTIKKLIFSKQAKEMDAHCDLLFSTDARSHIYTNKVPTLLSIHDIQHRVFPQFFIGIEQTYREFLCELSIRHTQFIQVSSNFIKNDLLQHFDFLKEKQLLLLREGVDLHFFNNSDKTENQILKKYSLPNEYLFYPAQLWSHKNHITLLKALKRIKERTGIELPLVLTGGKYSSANIILKFISENNMKNIFFLGSVPFEDIKQLHLNAKFLISTSLYESSCLPILEAMACGVPVIASAIPPNMEMAEVFQLNLYETNNAEQLASVIHDCWNNSEKMKKQISNNLKQIPNYSWDNIALQYLEAFKMIQNK